MSRPREEDRQTWMAFKKTFQENVAKPPAQ